MKTVVLLRHADITHPGPAPDNWPLNAAGLARANELVHVVGSAGITAIFASPAQRTQETVQPLAVKLGLSIQIPATQSQLVQKALSDQSGSTVLIAGHSNTIPQLIIALGAPFSQLSIQGHDDLFVVTVVGPANASAVRLKYGERSS